MISPTLAWIVGAFKQTKAFKQVPAYPQNSAAPTNQRSSETHRLNPDGLIEELNNNMPRQDWDVNNGKVSDYPCISLRKEEDNWTKYTQEFNNGLWQKTGGFIGQDNHTAPDGLQTAERFTTNQTNQLCYVHQNLDVKVTDSKIYTSVWVRDGGGTQGNPGTGYFTLSIYDTVNSTDLTYVTFDIINGVALDDGGANKPENILIKEYPNKWFRVGFFSSTGSGSSGTYQMRLYGGVNNPNTGTYPTYMETDNVSGQQIQFWGANITKTKYALPYIYATGSFTDCKEDSFNITNLQDYINSPTGLYFIHVKMAALQDYLTNSQAVISLNDNSAVNVIAFNFKKTSPNMAMNFQVQTGSQSFYQQDVDFANEIKLAVYYKTDYVELYYNGKSVYVDTSFVTFDNRVLQKICNHNGGGFNKFLEGDIYQTRFYDVRTLTSSQIKQLQKQLTQ